MWVSKLCVSQGFKNAQQIARTTPELKHNEESDFGLGTVVAVRFTRL